MKPLAEFLAFTGIVVSIGISVSGYHDDKDIDRILLQQLQHSAEFSGWGLADARTSIGRLFRYRIAVGVEPETTVRVVEYGKTQLPDWLQLSRSVDPLKNRDVLYLEGVSGPLARGKRYYIEVSYSYSNHSRTTVNKDNLRDQHSENQNTRKGDFADTESRNGNSSDLESAITGLPKLDSSDWDSLRHEVLRDIFAITVDDDLSGENTVDANEAAESVSRHGTCLNDKAMTRATVIIDDDFYEMSIEDRVSLVHRFCRHLGLSSQLVCLLPTENGGPLFDADWLVAGPGDTTEAMRGHAGVALQWDVGCNNVLASQMPALQTLETTVQDGSLRRAVGRGVIGWHVTKKTQKRRLKRHRGRLLILPTGTSFQTHPAPAARPVKTTTIISNEESSTSVGPGLRPSLPQPSVEFSSRPLLSISGQKASRNRQPGRNGFSKERQGRTGLAKNLRSPFATPTVAIVTPTSVLHVATKVVDEGFTSSADEEFLQSSIAGFVLEPSMPYVVSKFPEATTSLPIFRSRHFTAISETGMVPMTTSYTSIYTQATPLLTESFEDVVNVYSESLPLTTVFSEILSPAQGATDTSVTKYSKMVEEQTPDNSIAGAVWDGDKQPLITIAAVGTELSGQTTTLSDGQVDGAIGWLNRLNQTEEPASRVDKKQGYKLTSRKPANSRQQANLNSEAPVKAKTVRVPKKALNTTIIISSSGTKLTELKAIGNSEIEATSIDLSSTVCDTEPPMWTTPKVIKPLKLHPLSTVTRPRLTLDVVAHGGQRRLTTLPSTVKPNKRITSSTPLSSMAIRKKTSKRGKKKKTTRVTKKWETYAPNYAPNHAPRVLHELGNLDVLVGSVFRFRIPKDTFLDEDGRTDKLQLMLLAHDTDNQEDSDLTEKLSTLTPNSWVKLDESTQLLYGLPTEDHFGPHEYWLVARDKQSRLTKTRFEIRVRRRPSEDMALNHEFVAILQLDYEKVIKDVDTKINITRKIAAAFRDRSTDHVTVTGIRPGSVEFYWTNNSVQGSPCPVKTMTALRDHIISPDGLPTQAFVRAMHPHRVESVGFVPQGACLNSFSRPQFWDQAVRPAAMTTPWDEEVRKKPKETEDGNFLLYILIPMVGLAAGLLLLLVLCIVCHGCRQRKKTHDTKGIPVIFTEEMAAERPAGHRPRPVLADEVTSPFMLPPTYSQSLPGSRFSTMRSNYKPSDDDSSSGLSSDAERFSPRSIGRSFPGWPSNSGPPPPYMSPYQPRYV